MAAAGALALPAVLLCWLSGCGGSLLYEVRDRDNGGVPFFGVEQWLSQTNVYDEVFYQLKVSGSFEAPGAPKQTQTLVAYMSKSEDVAALYAKYLAAPDYDRAWAASYGVLVKLLGEPPPPAPIPPAPRQPPVPGKVGLLPFGGVTNPADLTLLPLVATSTVRIQQPSMKPRYFNVRVPFGGSTNGEADLNDNGTLGKAVAQKQDPLPASIGTAAGTIASALATGTGAALVTGLLPASTPVAAAAPASKGGPGSPSSVDFTVTVVHRLYTVTLSHEANAREACDSWFAGTDFRSTNTCVASVLVAIKSDGPGDKPRSPSP